MTFKPFGNKYNFSNEVLVKSFPEYLHDPIEGWTWKLLKGSNVAEVSSGYLTNTKRYIKESYVNHFQIIFREVFPQEWNQFAYFLFSDTDRLCNFLAYCLQNFADEDDAISLEYILSQGGSGYSVIKIEDNASEYKKGVYDLVERVKEIVMAQSLSAINQNKEIMEAWVKCYGRDPDYEKVVTKCQNFLEDLLKNTYLHAESKPQLGKMIGTLRNTPNKLVFKGDTVIQNKSDLLSLINNVPIFRGIHTAGTGKVPTKSEAEYVLHTTIYFWNLHQK